jgi:hypothetical protein
MSGTLLSRPLRIQKEVTFCCKDFIPLISLRSHVFHSSLTCYCSITFEVKLPSASSYIVAGLAICSRCSHYMLHADGNLTSKVIEQYSAAGC